MGIRVGADSSRFADPSAGIKAFGDFGARFATGRASFMQKSMEKTAENSKKNLAEVDKAHGDALKENVARNNANLSAQQKAAEARRTEPIADVNARIRENLGKTTPRNRGLVASAASAMGAKDGASFLAETPTMRSAGQGSSGPNGNRH